MLGVIERCRGQKPKFASHRDTEAQKKGLGCSNIALVHNSFNNAIFEFKSLTQN